MVDGSRTLINHISPLSKRKKLSLIHSPPIVSRRGSRSGTSRNTKKEPPGLWKDTAHPAIKPLHWCCGPWAWDGVAQQTVCSVLRILRKLSVFACKDISVRNVDPTWQVHHLFNPVAVKVLSDNKRNRWCLPNLLRYCDPSDMQFLRINSFIHHSFAGLMD